jgi:transposase
LVEFGIVTSQGIGGVGMLIGLAEDERYEIIPPLAREALVPILKRLRPRTRRSESWTIRFTPGTA